MSISPRHIGDGVIATYQYGTIELRLDGTDHRPIFLDSDTYGNLVQYVTEVREIDRANLDRFVLDRVPAVSR